MSYWIGYRTYEHGVDAELGAKILLGPYASRKKAKEEKDKLKGKQGTGSLHTDIFETESKEEATTLLDTQSFLKI